MIEVNVIGLGYIGLPTALLMASKGVKVHGVDTSQEVIRSLNNGDCHINEPGAAEMLSKALLSGNFTFSQKPERGEYYIIAVPTPFKSNKSADLSFVLSAIDSILPIIDDASTVIIESTCPPGTTVMLSEYIFSSTGNRPSISYCPERVLPGKIFDELVLNDRTIGAINETSATKTIDLYSRFVSGEKYVTDPSSAEMVKLVENSYRDVNIAFANEIAKICDDLNINPREVISLANKHPRVNILNPGPGVGGHCIAVDPWFIVEAAPQKSVLIKSARLVNDSMPDFVVEKISNMISGLSESRQLKILLLGLTYKADVDDFRESPALKIAHTLQSKYPGSIYSYDPYSYNLKDKSINLVDELETSLENADLIVQLVSHSQFSCIRSQKLISFA